METSSSEAVMHAPQVGRDMHARLAGTRPNQGGDVAPFWGEDGFTFDDLLDLINPLHHIPLVGSLYREFTGDQIAPGPRVLGGAIFSGGPVGAAVSMTAAVVNVGLEQETGKDLGGHMLAMVGIDGASAPARDAAPPAFADVTGLPWLSPDDPQYIARDTPTKPVQMAAVTVTPKSGAPPPAAQPRPEAAPEPIPSYESRTAIDTQTTSLSEEQWAMLVASVDQEATAPAPRSPMPESAPASASAPIPPADVAATMARALDRYAAISRNRGLDGLSE